MIYLDPIVYRPITQENLAQVAIVHEKAFPDAALTKLGAEATRRYYEWQLIGPHDCLALGAFEGEQLLGFCFGGIFRGSLNGFLRKNKTFLIRRVLTHPWLLFNSLFLDRISLALRSLKKRKLKLTSESIKREPSFGILAIAVDPLQQRRGIAGSLMEKSEEGCLRMGFTRMNLSVHIMNEGAIGFYQSQGWIKKPNGKGEWAGQMEKILK